MRLIMIFDPISGIINIDTRENFDVQHIKIHFIKTFVLTSQSLKCVAYYFEILYKCCERNIGPSIYHFNLNMKKCKILKTNVNYYICT